MAVYTHLGAEDLARLVNAYDVGALVSAKGIAEGVSNSNWLIETTVDRFILTMYERRIDTDDLPFFLDLLDHLAENGCAVPRTIHDRQGRSHRMIGDKAVALIEFLPGVSPDRPTPEQARAIGSELARLHLAARQFGQRRDNDLDIVANARFLADCGDKALASIDPSLPAVAREARALAADWPENLPRSVIHSDLFPDNVLMIGDRVSGLIDFYFACDGMMAYDLAVTHAAWCFDRDGKNFDAAISNAMLGGYKSVRPLEAAEQHALPVLAKGACIRFVTSRAQDWLEIAPDAIVTRKDPMDFVNRFRFYDRAGQEAFSGTARDAQARP